MTTCNHKHLTLLPPEKKRLRCRHCHLTIKPEDLAGEYCPECYEATGRRRYDFDEVASEGKNAARYRCEDCGILTNTEDKPR